MTLKEVANQISKLAVGGYINGEQYTAGRLHNQFRAMLRTGNDYIFEICLPDGRWMAEVYRVRVGSQVIYDYFIPDTRDQETGLFKKLGL